MSWIASGAAAGVKIGGQILGSNAEKKAAKKAMRSVDSAMRGEIQYAKEGKNEALGYQRPYMEAGNNALDALSALTGLAPPERQSMPALDNSYEFLRAGAATEYDITKAFEMYQGRKPTRKELKYYRRKERANELYHDIVVPGQEKQRATQQASAPPRPPPPTPQELLQADPGYQFRMNEGMSALEGSAAAGGGLLSGGFGKKALRFSQDLASQEYQNVYNRIATIAGYGQQAAGNSSNIAMDFGRAAGGATSNAGYARAQGHVAIGNSRANMYNEIAGIAGGFVGGIGGGGATSRSSSYTPINHKPFDVGAAMREPLPYRGI